MKLVIDCLGGDHSPEANIDGVVAALQQNDALTVILVGDEAVIRDRMASYPTLAGRIEIVHAPGVITGEDKPTDAIRLKKDSSMIAAIRLLREREDADALISNGATGALVAAATLRIGRIRGIRRPAFCPLLPTMTGGIVGICDSGANTDIQPEQLQQFAILGSRYLQSVYHIEAPRVALLNIGVESEKGDDLRKTAFPLLSATPGIHFVGNMESRDLLSGKYDLVVCDGFSGNVLIKATEGTALELLKKLKKDIYSKKRYQLGALLMKDMFRKEAAFMNYQNYGGSVLLGTEKIIVKGHGSSDAAAFAACIRQAVTMYDSHMNELIQSDLLSLEQTEGEATHV
ncbi:MAG: phosphate acyltransferase PlsX [Clostridia bacterium]|nr:phosphate acyltransferase PlsX [Clostridia bacterium]